MIYIFWFLFGFSLGVIFIEILKAIKKFLYKRSKRLRRKEFREKMNRLHND